MSAKTTPLYSVKGHTGAHFFCNVRDVERAPGLPPETFVDVQYVGAPLPFSVPLADVTPYQRETIQSDDIIKALAQEAAIVYGQDPQRITKAAELARNSHAIQQAHRDENGQPIAPSLNCLIVKGSIGWYIVRPGKCTCEDHKRGHTCKHRIAAWMRRESIIRPIAQARRTTPAIILAELTTPAATKQDW